MAYPYIDISSEPEGYEDLFDEDEASFKRIQTVEEDLDIWEMTIFIEGVGEVKITKIAYY